jgi:hypothetical protein
VSLHDHTLWAPFTNVLNSLQYHNGFCSRYLSMDSNMESGHAESREGRTVYNHESGRSYPVHASNLMDWQLTVG